MEVAASPNVLFCVCIFRTCMSVSLVIERGDSLLFVVLTATAFPSLRSVATSKCILTDRQVLRATLQTDNVFLSLCFDQVQFLKEALGDKKPRKSSLAKITNVET